MRIVKTLIVGTVLSISITGVVSAKGHDQRTDRGSTATTTTACSAFTLGAALGNGRGPSGHPALSC